MIFITKISLFTCLATVGEIKIINKKIPQTNYTAVKISSDRVVQGIVDCIYLPDLPSFAVTLTCRHLHTECICTVIINRSVSYIH